MTLAVLFHQLRFRQFKSFYLLYAQRYLRAEFPGLPSYQRCLELLPLCIAPPLDCRWLASLALPLFQGSLFQRRFELLAKIIHQAKPLR